MPRPGFVLEVDDKTPALLTMAGAAVRLQSFAAGTRVAYPADAVPSSNPVALIDAALDSPVEGGSLGDLLGPSVRLTIVVTDNNRPQPRMRFDVRRTIVERVLELAARRKVDDVQVVIATGLNRRWSERDVTAVLGDRVATSFLADGLITSHDVTSDDLVPVGEINGHEVLLNARVAASDLVVSVGTSGVVQPAASLPLLAVEAGVPVLEVTPAPTELTRIADVSWSTTAAQGLPLLVDAVRTRGTL